MKCLATWLVGSALMFGAVGAPVHAEKLQDRLQGRWTMIALTLNGEVIPEDQVKAAELEIVGDEYRRTYEGETDVAKIKIESSKSPATIDFDYKSGREAGMRREGILKLDGDLLTICRDFTGNNPIPKTFEAPADSGLVLVVWKRTAADKAKRLADELTKFAGVWQLVSAEADGEKTPEEQTKKIQVAISGQTHTVRFGDQVVAKDVRFDIDPFADPKTVTDTIVDGPDKGKTIEGIYRLEGDELISCTAAVGKPRPKVFEAGKASGFTLRTFRRVKP